MTDSNHPTTISRRALIGAGLGAGLTVVSRAAAPKRNILFLAIDDLNDWVGCLGGHPQTQTPNIDKLAGQGVLFTRAHCAAPVCNPSRSALLTGVRPSTSGVYANNQPFRESPVLKDAVTLPMHLRSAGYRAIGAGKIFHGGFPDPQSWDDYWPTRRENLPKGAAPGPEVKRPLNGIEQPGPNLLDWGPLDAPDDDMSDMKIAGWTADQLSRRVNDPLFLACGIFKPHLPWYVPRKYFDMFPLSSIQLPAVKNDDLNDVPPIGRDFADPDGDHKRITSAGKWKDGVRGYLATIAFADACVGRVLRALETGPNANDFSVVLWSDHGWHLGQKLHWRKFTLWEEATRNVLAIHAPGYTKPGGKCHRTVSLMDLYPTISEICGAGTPKTAGDTLIPVLRNPSAPRDIPALTTFLRGNHSVRDERWRYIRYSDGGEELYDHNNDPHEWTNLASKPGMEAVKKRLGSWMPPTSAPDSPVRRNPHNDDTGLGGDLNELQLELDRRRTHLAQKAG